MIHSQWLTISLITTRNGISLSYLYIPFCIYLRIKINSQYFIYLCLVSYKIITISTFTKDIYYVKINLDRYKSIFAYFAKLKTVCMRQHGKSRDIPNQKQILLEVSCQIAFVYCMHLFALITRELMGKSFMGMKMEITTFLN